MKHLFPSVRLPVLWRVLAAVLLIAGFGMSSATSAPAAVPKMEPVHCCCSLDPLGGGSEGVDIMPAIAVALSPSGLHLALPEVGEPRLIDDFELAQLSASASVRMRGHALNGDFVVFGDSDGAPALADEILAVLMVRPAPSAVDSLDVHPKQPSVKFKIAKTITTPKGEKKDIFGELEVERKSGEDDEEHAARAERVLEAWLKKGWRSIP